MSHIYEQEVLCKNAIVFKRNIVMLHFLFFRLPFDTDDGEEVIAEGCSSNKKDAVLACATEACRLIQTYDMMTNKTREDHRKVRQRELEANDYYDSDEDSFLDRTGNRKIPF